MDYSAFYRAIAAAYSAVPKRLLRGYAFPPLQIFVELTWVTQSFVVLI